MVDHKSLVFISTIVLSLGVPKTGLLTMLKESSANTPVRLYVADIGISNVAWKRFGIRRKRGIEFGNDWVASLRYQGGVE